jgi:hypothetical protein
MAILKGATSSKTFADGFREGTSLSWASAPPFQRCPLQKGGKTVGSPI